VAGVDFVGAEGGADGVEVAFDGSQLRTFFKPSGRDVEYDRADNEDGDEDQDRGVGFHGSPDGMPMKKGFVGGRSEVEDAKRVESA
jgi:hypothetical protein